MSKCATEIVPNLWIGDDKSYCNKKFLVEAGIKFIINCTKDIPENGCGIENIRINVDDKPSISHAEDNETMYNSLSSCVEYVHQRLGKGQGVLVHCRAGKQRSASVVAAYLIKYGEVDVDKAVYYIRTKRPIAFTPMNNFLAALKKYTLLVSK